MAAGEACGREGGGKPGALVQRAYNQAAQRLLAARGASPRTPRWMALEEFSVRKGHPYQTAICDLERREVLEVVEGHKAQSVQAYLEKLPEPERVEAVVMYMHEPYRQVVQLCCPGQRVWLTSITPSAR